MNALLIAVQNYDKSTCTKTKTGSSKLVVSDPDETVSKTLFLYRVNGTHYSIPDNTEFGVRYYRKVSLYAYSTI